MELGLSLGASSSSKLNLNMDLRLNSDIPAPIQLDLLPRWSSGSSEGGSGVRGFDLDVNRMPDVSAAAAAGAAEEVSSPNSVASSFQMEFGMFKRVNRGGDGGGSGNGNDVVECGRVSDDDENALARKKLRLSKEQSAFLEESFKEHNTLNPKQKVALAKQLNLRPRQVEVWFQNRRARTKLKQTEVDCEYLKRCCETLTEENRRLHKELQELRALKTSNPFYMQLPATTLTMCPSCERVATTTTSSATTAATVKPVNGTTNGVNGVTVTTPLFPLSRQRLVYPFSNTPPTHPHQSAAS